MKATDKTKSIQENLDNPEFVKMLREHPVVQRKIKRAKAALAATKK